jgi:hypothetical protein
MADNISLNPGSGGDTVAADEVSSAKYQRVKIVPGGDGNASNDGCTPYRKVSNGISGDAESVKASAGVVYGIAAMNTAATDAFLHLYNTAGTPTVGTTAPAQTYILLPDGGISIAPTHGIKFDTGVAVGIATTVGGSTGVTADSVVVNLLYV